MGDNMREVELTIQLLDELDEHAIDSIAVGYTCLQLDIFKGVP